MTPLALALALLVLPAGALDPNDDLVLDLAGGGRVEGWYVGVDGGVLRLSGDNRFVDVPVDQVLAVQRDGAPLALGDFQAELAEAQARLDALRADPPPRVAPAVAVGASVLYAGAGHAALGEWRGALLWGLLDTAILSAAAWNLFGEESLPAAIPVLALDAVIKGAAAGDAARRARRHPRMLQGPVGNPPGTPSEAGSPP